MKPCPCPCEDCLTLGICKASFTNGATIRGLYKLAIKCDLIKQYLYPYSKLYRSGIGIGRTKLSNMTIAHIDKCICELKDSLLRNVDINCKVHIAGGWWTTEFSQGIANGRRLKHVKLSHSPKKETDQCYR